MRILIVEDDWTSREMLRGTLTRLGHDVLLAEDGQQAWDLFRAGPVPMIITDWIMPNLSGLELCRLVRQSARNAYTYVVLLTVKTDRESLLEAFEAGADDFLPKPFDPAELLARLRCGERVIQLEEQLASRIRDLGRANEKMKQDLRAAARIQESLLPSGLPRFPGVRFAWCLRSCDELAGDIFNVFPLDDRHIGVYLLDVSGHGVAAALMSVTLSRLLAPVEGQSLVTMRNPDGEGYRLTPPALLLSQLNSRFQISEASGGQYFTIVYGIFDRETGSFRYAQAGHPPVAFVENGQSPAYLDGGGLPVGFVADAEFEEHEIQTRPGARLFLYSDGIIEAMHPERGMYGAERFLSDLAQLRETPLDEAVDKLVHITEEWQQSCGGLEDDISILAIEVERPG